ncbi:uncharacterized protein LOC108117021 [Drosophila eugracilis]|uniref:uncharacterized protein LOC108117021 n=1 Tax=Drosophila eugracilis TaxID=29029 RepID=UPI0007E7E41C|nr:uncharacterized protein LOC108117021 [Drosophila eugracilis]
MKFLAIIALVCALAGMATTSDWSQDSTTSYPYWTDTTTEAATTTTTAPVQPPCDEKIQGPCGKLLKGAQKIYFFY